MIILDIYWCFKYPLTSAFFTSILLGLLLNNFTLFTAEVVLKRAAYSRVLEGKRGLTGLVYAFLTCVASYSYNSIILVAISSFSYFNDALSYFFSFFLHLVIFTSV
jgi:hypothetical protein